MTTLDSYLSTPLAQRMAMRKRRPAHVTHTPILNPANVGAPFKVGSSLCQWHETPAFRRVGFADKVARSIKHLGWFMNEDFQDEVARGEVYRLPHGRFLAAIADPFNDGPAIIERYVYKDELSAALAADSLAEAYAEAEREYQRQAREDLARRKAETEAREREHWEQRDTLTV